MFVVNTKIPDYVYLDKNYQSKDLASIGYNTEISSIEDKEQGITPL